MTNSRPVLRYRFGTFEVDTSTSELRRQGVLIKLNGQPFQLLCLLLERPGELLAREEISRILWPDGTFVDYEHGVNSAMNRVREALGDAASSPRFIETLARRGYRFVAPVERISEGRELPASATTPIPNANAVTPAPSDPSTDDTNLGNRFLASPGELPKTRPVVVKTLFVALQLMYVAFYVGALANLAEIQDLLAPLPQAASIYVALTVTAACLIPVRAFLLTAALLHPPGASRKLLKIWPALLVMDEIWALSPFLLLHHINFGLAVACTTLLVYAPFAQRSLVLMGAANSGGDLLVGR